MKKKRSFLMVLALMISLLVFMGSQAVFAENIDPDEDDSQYAYGENVRWFNAEPLGNDGLGVHVSDDALTGYIWAENIGWINLSPTNYGGVSNDGSGSLSGYAWGENVGWINFAPNVNGAGVTIDPATGEFGGYAWGENIGWINFAQITGGRIKTDYWGPVTSLVMADPNPAPVNTDITLTAHVDDSETGGSIIDSAEYRIDDSESQTMYATVGDFDDFSEDVYASVHLFTEAGVYNLCVSGADSSGNTGPEECVYLAVYDSDGGFVTGGGWIMSPEEAYADDSSLTGKANFGFVSKYKKGANVPTGNTKFQFKAGNLDFHSDSYEWLVVNQAGTNAQYKGNGTINGGLAPNDEAYKFMIWAKDLEPDADTFRIKIWWEDEYDDETLVYDNGFDQLIGGGNIKIHLGN
jgi:hypothetical protein